MMKPGRELDALVAEKVMYWPVYRTKADIPDHLELEKGEMFPVHPNGTFCFSVPFFSGDIGAAWKVVNRLAPGNGDHFDLKRRKSWSASFAILNERAGRWLDVHAQADTAPHAICLAALKAVGAL